MRNEFDIKNSTSFKIGGNIKQIYFPTSTDEFIEIINSNPSAKILGNMSNVLISSDGFDGVVISTVKMSSVFIEENTVIAECGVKGAKLALETCKNGLAGLEFMAGFPGTVGGNIYMNASANGQSTCDNLVSVKCYNGKEVKSYTKENLNFSYRHSRCQDEKLIVLSAEFILKNDKVDSIQAKINECLTFRKEHQPSLVLPNCGSVFKNPENTSAGRLLDSVDAKNMYVGGARVWQHHANFIINEHDATSLDVLQLMDKMVLSVEDKYGIRLLPEIKFLGNKNKQEEELCKKLQIELI